MGGKRSISLYFLLVGIAFASDFEAGRQAFEKGDFAGALKEWQPLAEQGAPLASYNLALMYAKGQGVKQDYSEAAKWYQKAAEKGIPEAQYNLGMLYSNGLGVPKDYTEAAKWFQKAAEKGDVNAENNLGTLYDAGEGSFRNFAEAEKWYRKAAEKGNSNAQFNLGVMYDLGQGVKSDFTEAEKWYRKAADQWNEGALCNLAILYYNGQGVPRDLIQAHAYFLLAQEAGDPRASNLMQVTTNKLNAKQIQKAKEVAAQFKTGHKEQILLATNPSQKPPIEGDSGPERAGMYAKPELPPASSAFASPSTAETETKSAPAAPVAAPAEIPETAGVWTGVDRVVAVGDIHGDYEQLTAVLRAAKVIDGQDNWSGGKTHLVQTGDVVDEGPDARRILDLLMKLEKQAQTAGGYVHCLMGNHEAMNIYGDLRFVSPAGFSEFRTDDSEKLRQRYYEQYQKDRANYAQAKGFPAVDETPQADWMKQHPAGFFEHQEAFAPTGIYGKWILGHDTVIRINDTLFSHAGISPKFAKYSIADINRTIREELSNPQNLQGGMVTDLQGPLWYSGLARGEANEASIAEVGKTLDHFGAKREVVAHIDGANAVLPGFKNRVMFIDVGIARLSRNTGTQACLMIEKDQLYALHQGHRLELPKDDQADLIRYLKEAAAVDPEPSSLLTRIQQIESKSAITR